MKKVPAIGQYCLVINDTQKSLAVWADAFLFLHEKIDNITHWHPVDFLCKIEESPKGEDTYLIKDMIIREEIYELGEENEKLD